jgi:hypothetical protein
MKALTLIIVILLFSTLNVLGQVGDVNKNVKKDKDKSGNTKSTATIDSGSTSSSGGWFLGLVVEAFAVTIGAAQRAALENVDIYPERFSLESFTTYGTDINSDAQYFQAGLRGNWGIFGSDFKYTNLTDITGQLKTIDWQVLVIRIPIKDFKIDYGLGFISILEQEQAYFNSSLGFDWRLPNLGVNITSAYQWSQKTSLGTRYKRGFILRADYEVYGYKKFHLSPMLEYAYQNYFEETTFSVISAGVILRLF